MNRYFELSLSILPSFSQEKLLSYMSDDSGLLGLQCMACLSMTKISKLLIYTGKLAQILILNIAGKASLSEDAWIKIWHCMPS